MGILRTNEISGLETPTPVTGSVYFDGTGDYLRIDSTSDFAFGTGDFTMECWYYPTGGSLEWLMDCRNVATSQLGPAVYTAGTTIRVYINGSVRIESPRPPQGKWYHTALVRNNGITTLYVDGISQGTYSDSTNYVSTNVRIGANEQNPPTIYGTQYSSNVRILKGTALYTSDFTPPEHELQPIGDTVLLCCNNPDSAGAEATGKTITVNGDAAASTFSPGLTRDFTYGTQFEGVAKFDTQGYFVPPSGNTQNRYTLGLDEIVTDGLVLHLDAGNPFSYPATGVGTKWTDLSGNNNHGTLNGGVSYTENNRGSLVFDGVNDYVRVTTSSPTSYNTFSYGAWIYANDTSGYRTIIDRDNDKWSLFVFDGNLITFNQTFNSGYTIDINQWYYVNVTHIDGEPVIFYVNGSLVYTSSNSTIQHTTSYFGIGAGFSTLTSGNEFWVGSIAQVQIYNKALTASEVLQNYNALKGRYGHS